MSNDDDADRIARFNGRTFERTQGCWNCKHSTTAVKFWTDRREALLSKALTILMESPEGENDPKVIAIRTAVNNVDHDVASHRLMRCTNKKSKMADGSHMNIDDNMVAHSFLCDGWSAAEGASIARAGQRADDLPEELQDKIDGSGPKTIADILGGQEVN